MLNLVLYAALRVAAVVLPRLPERFGYTLADAAGTLSYYLFPIARSAILANYEVALPESTARGREDLARAAFRTDAKNWLDTLRIPRFSREAILRRVHVDGFERLDEALRRGAGAVLVSLHLGNFDLVGQSVAASGYQLTVPVEHMKPEALYRYLKQQRESQGVHLVALEEAPRAMLRALKRGELVGMTADRHLSGKAIRVRFFGLDTMLPRGPAAVSVRTGAPLLICVGVRVGPGQFHGWILPPLVPPRGIPETLAEQQLSQQIASHLEHFVRRFPDQWLAFTRLWPAGTAFDDAATIEEQKKAAV